MSSPGLGWVDLRVVPRMGLHVPFALTPLAYVSIHVDVPNKAVKLKHCFQ